jgi:hypothetical protein
MLALLVKEFLNSGRLPKEVARPTLTLEGSHVACHHVNRYVPILKANQPNIMDWHPCKIWGNVSSKIKKTSAMPRAPYQKRTQRLAPFTRYSNNYEIAFADSIHRRRLSGSRRSYIEVQRHWHQV